MATITKSKLKELFKENNLSDGIFDIFNRKRKRLDKKITDLKKSIEDTIESAPNDEERDHLRDLNNAIIAMKKAGVKLY